MAMKPVIHLKVGDRITPIRTIVPATIKNWPHASECADIGGGLMPRVAELKIVEIGKTPGNMWVRAELPGRSPPAFLKIAGEILSLNFHLL